MKQKKKIYLAGCGGMLGEAFTGFRLTMNLSVLISM